jgi:hypothetical protein
MRCVSMLLANQHLVIPGQQHRCGKSPGDFSVSGE